MSKATDSDFSEPFQTILAHFSLEGLEPSPALKADMHQLDLGELTPEQFKQKAIDRAKLLS